MTSWLLFVVASGFFLLALVTVIVAIQQVWFPVGYIPSSRAVTDEMARMADLKPGMTVMDLGAGDGRLLIAAKRAEPGVAAVGVEGALFPWLLSKFFSKKANVSVDLRLGNLLRADIGSADVIFAYLWPSILKKLAAKLAKEAKAGCVLISHAFPLPGKEPFAEREVAYDGTTHVVRAYRVA